MKRVISFVKGGGKGRGGASDVVPVRNLSFEGGLDDPPGYEVDTKTLSKLHRAAWLGQLDKLKGRAEQLDAPDKGGRSALHLAAAQGHADVVWFLISNRAKPASLELRTACPPSVGNGRRRENVTLRLMPRVNGGRRCQSCVRQNSDSSCGSGQALLAHDSIVDSANNTPQHRKRPASSVETSLSSSGMGRSLDSSEQEDGDVRPSRPKLQRLPAVEDED